MQPAEESKSSDPIPIANEPNNRRRRGVLVTQDDVAMSKQLIINAAFDELVQQTTPSHASSDGDSSSQSRSSSQNQS